MLTRILWLSVLILPCNIGVAIETLPAENPAGKSISLDPPELMDPVTEDSSSEKINDTTIVAKNSLPALLSESNTLKDPKETIDTIVPLESPDEQDPTLPQFDHVSAIAALLSKPNIANQRHWYTEALNAIKKKRYNRYFELKEQLKDYPLYPYLEYRYLIKNTGKIDTNTIARFQEEYQSARWSGYLLDVYLRALLKKGDDNGFLENYSDRVDDTELACEHLEKLYQNDRREEAFEKAAEMWLSPFSLPSACDPMFTRLIEQKGISTDNARQRFLAAFEDTEVTLAKYLVRFLSEKDKPFAEKLLGLRQAPHKLKQYWPDLANIVSSEDSQLWDDAIYRVIKPTLRKDQKQAIAFINKRLKPLADQGNGSAITLWEKSADYLILREALDDLGRVPRLYAKLGKPGSPDSLEWLARAHLHNAQWKKVVTVIELMPDELRSEDNWKYWRLRAMQLRDDNLDKFSAEDLETLKQIAGDSNFYGFAAANVLKQPYQINPQEPVLNDSLIKKIIQDPNISRAIEFYFHSAYNQANAEWYQGLRNLEKLETGENLLLSAAYLADSIGWNNQAISTAARAEAWKHYAIRFPCVYGDSFSLQSTKYGVPTEWLYATARQESALSPRARSMAGALGLMQLMPNTAKQQASKLGLSYNPSSLNEPSYNIVLGSSYLNSMMHRYRNKALASAAYNAGPHRVDKWLKTQDKPIPLDAWIETIRFNETRQYVKNILSFGLIKNNLGQNSISSNMTLATHSIPYTFMDKSESIVFPYKKQVASPVDF